MKPNLRMSVTGLARAALAQSSTLRRFLLPILLLAVALPAAAQSRGFFLPDNQDEVAVGEAAGSVTLFVGRCCGAELLAATVELVTVEGSATESLDYTRVRTNLVFAAGQTNRTVQIPVLEDALIEAAESFEVRLQNATGGTALDPHNVTRVRIVDDDRGFFLPATLYAYEPNSLVVTAQREGGPGLPAASVELVTADGTAKAGADYTAVKTTVLFAAGQKFQSVTIPLLDDTLVEGPETFTVTLQNPTGGTPVDHEHTANVNIQDDDRGFTFGTASLGVSEDSSSAGLYVSRFGANLPAATVELVASDGTAKAGLDYTAVKTNLTFAAGQTQQYVQIPLLNDALVEGEETFTVRLQNPVGFPLDPNDTTLTFRIQDNDRGFVVRGAAPDYGSARENRQVARFEVAIVGDFLLSGEVSVTVSTQDGTAKAGADYQAASARLVFAPGERVKSFDVPILNDALAEGNETYFVTLSQLVGAPVSYLAHESKFSATIVDNELGYRLGDSATPGQGQQNFVFRAGETATVTVWRDGDFDVTSTVKLNLVTYSDSFGEEGTATAGADFPTNSLVVNFGPGETRQTVTFDLPDDDVNGLEKTFFLTLEAGDGIAPVQPDGANARAHILDSGVLPALVDPDFDLAVSAAVRTYYEQAPTPAMQPDGKLIYVADRLGYDGHPGSVILRALPGGQPDPAWQPAMTVNRVYALALTPGGEVVVALDPNFGEEDVWDHQLFRLHADGTRDGSFKPATDGGTIRSLLVYPDGRVLVAYPDNLTLGRFLANGQPDLAFIPPVLDDSPRSIQLDAAGNLLVSVSSALVRLQPNGTRDMGFTSPADPVSGDTLSEIQSVLALADGQLLVIARSPTDGQMIVIRLRSDGTTDPGFAPQRASYYSHLVATSGGAVWLLRESSNLYLLGWFLERLLPDGNRDPGWVSQQILGPVRTKFDSGPNPKLVPLPDGELLVINAQLINGQPRHRAAKLLVHPGLHIVVDPATARVPENAGNATLQLLRSGPVTNALTLGWATEPITAVPGTDYTPASGTVTFPAGHRAATITVPVLDNDRPDRDRLVRLRFTAAPGAPVPPPAGFAIANDDLGFPPDGIRALADGLVLLRPTGWLEGRGWLQLEMGALEDLQSGNPGATRSFAEPIPEVIQYPEGYSDAGFFRVVNRNPVP